MAKYKCSVCGFIFDETTEGKSFAELEHCPVCQQPKTKFIRIEDNLPATPETAQPENSLSYDLQYVRNDEKMRYMDAIHEMAVSGKTIIGAMGTTMAMPNWDDILILGAQLNPAPLLDDEPVITTVVIGKNAKRPLIAENPVFVSHMSFGALSAETKVALAKGTAMSGSVQESGEGGILPEEREAANKYIFEYIPNKYSVTD